jgi:hypothetical protein
VDDDDDDGLTSTDGGIRVDDVTIVLLLPEVVTEWGFGAVVVPIVFDVDKTDDDDNKEGTIFDELVIDGRTLLLILS